MSTAITIGDMRQVGTFRTNTPVANSSGGTDDNFSDLLTCRGRLRQQKGSNTLEQGDFVISKGYEWVCRFQNALVINTDTSLVIKGQAYKINSYEKIDELNHFYKFSVSLFQ